MKKISLALLLILLIGFLIPQKLKIPVHSAGTQDINPKSFWHPNWGKSVVHKGVDIFAKKGESVYSSTRGIVLLAKTIDRGGKAVLILGPKWRLHYYAHLNEIKTTRFSLTNQNTVIGTVGNTGNARTTPSHLHYSIVTIIPYFWKADKSRQGWKKMFYLNPMKYINPQY